MTDNSVSKIGIWIRACLADMGKNQAWLAERIGVQPPQVSRIIKGESEATPDILIAIADALGKRKIDAFRAAGYIEPASKTDESTEQLIHEYSHLSPADREEVLAFARMLHNLRQKKK